MGISALEQVYANGEAGTLLAGTPVCYKSPGAVQAARADSAARAEVIGIAQEDTGPTLPVTVTAAGLCYLNGLTPGATYYLGATGGMTTTPPSTVGQFIVEIGQATEADALELRLRSPVKL